MPDLATLRRQLKPSSVPRVDKLKKSLRQKTKKEKDDGKSDSVQEAEVRPRD